MTTIRLFGNDITVAEKEKKEKEENSIMLFGKRIFSHAAIILNMNKNKKQQRYDRIINNVYVPIPDLPPPNMCLAIRFVQGSRPVYIGWKYVENSDIKLNLSRFLIPAEYCTELLHCMSELERVKIVNEDDTGLKVSVMDPRGNLHGMNFTRWKSLERLVFNRGWNKLVRENHLQKGDLLDLWHFRTPYYKPCFAINIIKND